MDQIATPRLKRTLEAMISKQYDAIDYDNYVGEIPTICIAHQELYTHASKLFTSNHKSHESCSLCLPKQVVYPWRTIALILRYVHRPDSMYSPKSPYIRK